MSAEAVANKANRVNGSIVSDRIYTEVFTIDINAHRELLISVQAEDESPPHTQPATEIKIKI